MANKTRLNINLKSSLNRAIVYTIFPTGKPLNFTVYHHKRTSAIQFEVDSRSQLIKNKQISYTMQRNLESCDFAKTFFKLENLKVDKYDYQCKFAGPRKLYEKNIYPFMKEKLDLHAGNSNDKSTNYLLILGWKLIDLDDDLMYIFVQRRCYNNVSRTNVLRTAGLQFATKRGLQVLNDYVTASQNVVQKIQPDEISGIFEDTPSERLANEPEMDDTIFGLNKDK